MSARRSALDPEMWRETPLVEPVLVWTNGRGWVKCCSPGEVIAIVGERNDFRILFALTIEERRFNCAIMKGVAL